MCLRWQQEATAKVTMMDGKTTIAHAMRVVAVLQSAVSRLHSKSVAGKAARPAGNDRQKPCVVLKRGLCTSYGCII